MAKRMILCVLIVAVCGGAFFVGGRLAAVQIASTARPFLIEMQENLTSGDNPAESLGEYHFFNAVRSDGSHVYGNISKGQDGSWQLLSRRMELLPERKISLVSDPSQRMSTFRRGATKAAQLALIWGRRDCVPQSYKLVGEDFIQGYRVLKVERKDRGAHWQRWVSPDLACYDLKVHIEFYHTDGTIETINDQTAVLIREGEPPAELFDLSESYVEVAPSTLFLRGAPFQTAPEHIQKKLQKVDQAYEGMKTNPPQ